MYSNNKIRWFYMYKTFDSYLLKNYIKFMEIKYDER